MTDETPATTDSQVATEQSPPVVANPIQASEQTDASVAVTISPTSDTPSDSSMSAQIVDAEHDVERDTRSLIRRLLDEAEADIDKGETWFKAEVAKL